MTAKARLLSVQDQLAVLGGYPSLLPVLIKKGLCQEDAVALAHNAVFLCHALEFDPPVRGPRQLLEQLGAGQIARLCEEYQAARSRLERVELQLPAEEAEI